MLSVSRYSTPCAALPMLSPGIAYYLRRLLRQNLDRFVTTHTEQGQFDGDVLDLNGILAGLYPLEEKAKLESTLERLALVHQALSRSASRNRQELRKTEHQIFQIFGFELKTDKRSGDILLVDDDLTSLNCLSIAILRQGYRVHTARGGKGAVASLQSVIPDVILLDIVMPDMDGFAVCEYLKSNSLTHDIPIIFLSSLNDANRKVKAFHIGGADYVTKPCEVEEVLARIEHQLSIRSLQKRLEEQNIRLQEEIRERQRAEAQYRDMFEHAIDGLFQSNPAGEFLQVNHAFARMCGYSSPPDLMDGIWDIGKQLYVQSERYSALLQDLEKYDHLAGIEAQIYRKDGSKLWISINLRTVRDAQGLIRYYEGIVRPVSGMDP